jgi:tetratricopeptide (TPR) repeat protein
VTGAAAGQGGPRAAAEARAPESKHGSATARRWALAAAAAALVVAVGYLHTLRYPFHFDDFDWIRDNPALRPPLDLAAIWDFRPSRFVANLTFALDWITRGGAPASFRATNLLIHWIAALLVGWIAAELTRAARAGGAAVAERRAPARPGPPGAPHLRAASPATVGLIAALLFAAHPLATQSVTYLTQRITSLAALLVLASVAAFLRARRGRGQRWWVAHWALALAAALTKEMAVALPFAIVGLEGWLRAARAPGRAGALRLAPGFLIVPLVVWAARHPLGPEQLVAGGLRETADIGRLEYFLTQMTVIPRYLGLAFWPAGQCLDPVPPLHSTPDTAVMAGAALLVALTIAAIAFRVRAPLALAGWGWFLVTVAPESSLIPIRDLMMEQRAYLPLAGLCWAAAAGLATLPARAVRMAAVVALVVALTTVTHARNRVWRDELSLWADSVAKSPASARAQNNLGLALEAGGRSAEAEQAYRAAIAAEPAHVFARVNLGRLYGRSGRADEALRVLEEADALAPGDPLVLNNLATVWWSKGDTARAAALYGRALDADPASPYPAANLARLRRGLPAP